MPGFAALSLTNDLYSWEKERDSAKSDGLPNVVNAIWVIMEENSIGEDMAKEICRRKIKEYVAVYRRTVAASMTDVTLSKDLRLYVEAIMYSISGNLVWSKYCPRYNKVC